MTEKPKQVAKPNPNLKAASVATQWKPGESGNKAGYSLKSRLDDAIQKPLKDPGEDATAGERLVHATLKGAIELQPTPFRETWDRTEGKLTDTPLIQDNRVINFIVSGDKAKELMEGVEEFGIFNRENDD